MSAPRIKCYQLQIATILIVIFIQTAVLSQNLTISGPQCANNTILLTCREVAYTEIEWKNGSTTIKSSPMGRYTFKNNRTILEIQNVTQYDNGSVITCGYANKSSISNPVTVMVYELLERPRNVDVMVTNVTFMAKWDGICDNISSADNSPPVTGYIIRWYNLTRDILGHSTVPSSCEDNENEPYTAYFTSESTVQFVSVTAENLCGSGKATNIVHNNALIVISPEKYAVVQLGQTLTISCISSYNNDTLQWFQENTAESNVHIKIKFFSSNQSATFNVTSSYYSSTFYCTFENHPIYYNVFTELVLLHKALSFTINGFELPAVSIISNFASSSSGLHTLLCAGTEGNRQLWLHENTSGLSKSSPSGMMPLYNIKSQNYSAAIELIVETKNLPPLFISTLTCKSAESGETVSLILTSSSLYVHVVDMYIVIDGESSGPLILSYIVALNSTGYSNNLDQISNVWVQFTNAVNGSVMNFTNDGVNDAYNLTSNENGYDLVLPQVDSQTNSGQYTLFAVARDGTLNNAATITVTFEENVPVITIDPMNMTIQLNSDSFSVSLSCEADGATSYYWERQNRSIPSKATGIDTATLVINYLQPDDAGNYRCIATNTFGSTFSRYATLVANVEPPSIIVSPSSQRVNLAQTAIFTCMATGYNVSYEWITKTRSLPNKTIDTKYTNTLVIPDVRASDYNIYVCKASNKGGDSMSAGALLIITGFPKVTVVLSGHNLELVYNVEVTHNVTFTAIASGVGLENFTYQWTYKSLFVTNETETSTIIHGNETNLTITNVMESESGLYVCSVRNVYGNTAISNGVILIMSRNVPVITIDPVDILIKDDTSTTNVSFTCEAEGATSYKWEKQSGNISSNATGVNTTVLTINSIQPDDIGRYRCVATNASGSIYSEYAMLSINEFFECAREIDSTYGFNWPSTNAGDMAIVYCLAMSDTSVATRLCNNNNVWGNIDVSNCESHSYSDLFTEVQFLGASLLLPNRTNIFNVTNEVVNLTDKLSHLTQPTQNKSILPLDIKITNNILSLLLMVSSIFPEILNLENFVNNTATVFSNVLDNNNIIGWNDLLTINELSSHQLLGNSEKFTLQLANHAMLLGMRSRDIIKDNIVISTEVQMDNFSDFIFPSQHSMLNNSDFVDSFGTPYASIVIPSSVLRNTSVSQNNSVAVGSVLYRTISRLLPNYTLNNRNDTVRVGSIVLSSQILGSTSFANDEHPIQLNFQQNTDKSESISCGFLDENVNGSGWSTRGVTLKFSNGSYARCLSTHLTTFAILVSLHGKTDIPKVQQEILTIFTYIGCGVSLVCLALTIIVLLIFFKSLLKDLHYFVHFNLSIALFMGLATFLAGIDHAKGNNVACTIVAALLHYFFTAVFTWMMCEGIMIYLLLVKVFETNITRKRWPFLLGGWGTPLLIVGISVGIAHDEYGNEDYCWLSTDKGTIWGFVGPVLFFVIVNLIFLILGVRATIRGRISHAVATGKQEELNKLQIAKWFIRDTLFLLPTFGITWVFGILALSDNLTVFAWLFVFLNSTQGLLIFILYIIRQEKVKDQLHKLFCSKSPTAFMPLRSISMFQLSKSHTSNHRLDPSTVTVEVNRYVTDPL